MLNQKVCLLIIMIKDFILAQFYNPKSKKELGEGKEWGD